MPSPPRLHALDALRGLATLLVVMSHCVQAVPETLLESVNDIGSALASPGNIVVYSGLKFVALGRSSVILFFVLSGFALACSLEYGTLPYPAYAVKRFFRIYPPLLVAILASYALHRLLGCTQVPGSHWLNTSMCGLDLSPRILAVNLLLPGTDGSAGLDTAVWSLMHELRVSMVFPLIYMSVRRWRFKAVAGWLALSLGCMAVVCVVTHKPITGYREPAFWLTWLDSGYFTVFFAAGALLAIEKAKVAAALRACPAWITGLCAAACALCMLAPHNADTLEATVDYLKGLSALFIIAGALALPRFERWLNRRPLRGLGHVSYSLYLIHLPVLYLATQGPLAPLSFPALFVMVPCVSILAAGIMAWAVEDPGRALGARLAGAWTA